MNSYRHGEDHEEEGIIGFNVTNKTTVNGMVCLTIQRTSTTMPPLLTYEIERIVNSLRATDYVKPTTTHEGFKYTFGEFIFGH